MVDLPHTSPHTPPPTHRGLVTISGKDAFPFLQAIISNDLTLLESQAMLWACLLTPQGKYLHDFFVGRTDNSYTLNCESGDRADDLARRLSLYKLRSDISIAVSQIQPAGDGKPFDEWDKARIRLALPDGSRDAEIGVSTLAELNLDDATVSYTKGCYIGQELVARMHNRNLGKKHLVAVEFDGAPPAHGTEIQPFGQMRSSNDTIGLILMGRELEDGLRQGSIKDAPFRLLGL